MLRDIQAGTSQEIKKPWGRRKNFLPPKYHVPAMRWKSGANDGNVAVYLRV
jgi:hypothetical protein